ncbi:hypothetical protein P152DRAFT_315283 [Eremomyces bilateralis CBS 781.70]|uniref:CENP-V/GFA domain-containing protein n=1 Tax=Eremomyces bilateralis CBS 781.70 TaxID=1392243 RepID=A0A6G1G682_9PEZI|nr:uncharacterized protein P152DRAFT_315283 [Eremomyces bilateralis CBS 781.70]KAF1813339.1 hypothetical protein P152DRAFT_315283 [Eremomyces bilateralis CBS 781.70]
MSTTTEDQPSQTYSGHCHCGAHRFTVTVSPPLGAGPKPENTGVTHCNCSICHLQGLRFIYVDHAAVTFTKGGPDGMTPYQFAKKNIAHRFCPTCGTFVISQSVDPDMYPNIRAVNMRCLAEVNVDDLRQDVVDGKKLEPLYKLDD